MNIPNLITVGRFLLVPIFIFTFFSKIEHSNLYSFFIIILAGLSDMLDGYLARKNNQITEVGKLLDPLADKLMMLAVIFSLVIDQRVTLLAAGFIFFRDIAMIITSAFFHFQQKKRVPTANVFGKATTLFFYVALFMVMFQLPYYQTVLWSVILFSFITSVIYLIVFIRMNEMKRASQM